MKQKSVSFKVAKAVKEAGYPQGNTDKCYLTSDHNHFYKEGQIVENEDGEWTSLTKNLADIPTYLDVWLWLWREKKICINCNYDKYNLLPMWWCNNEDRINYNSPNFDDPEEAIIETIEYLVENNLIK